MKSEAGQKIFPHIFLDNSGVRSEFISPPSGGGKEQPPPDRNYKQHSALLRSKLDAIWKTVDKTVKDRTAVSLPVKQGVYLEFESAANHELVTQSLEDRQVGIRLLTVRTIPETAESSSKSYGTVFVPVGKESHFLKKLRKYEDEKTKSGEPKNKKLINSIEDVRLALLESFWQDTPQMLPGETPTWCEIWLRDTEGDTENTFRKIAKLFNIEVQEDVLRFPERMVLLAKVNNEQLNELIESSPYIAELRRAKETARFFLGMDNKDQTDWTRDLLKRTNFSTDPQVAVTILDSGANNGHLLLEPILKVDDCHAVNPDWGVDDHYPHGHGTLMCGVAGYGDLLKVLEGGDKVDIRHCLESVKIIPRHGSNDPLLYGEITTQGVSRVEITQPHRSHIGCMAVTAKDGRDMGRPSSWSAALDKLTSGHDDNQQRLFVVAAGNIEDQVNWGRYPDSNKECPVHDPGQSWNALTVGAFTNKAKLTDPDLVSHAPIASLGGLSPFSSTSMMWEGTKWPIKPDIVMEGGNLAKDADGYIAEYDDLSVLTTGHEHTKKQFGFINATSAATAQAAWMAANIQAKYPKAWPETIRGLMVHSAQWTEEMKRQFLNSTSKTDHARLLRVCGYGVPNLDNALTCFQNNLTLIAQETIQPFDKDSKSYGFRTKEMHLHELPWPRDVLLSLGEAPVTLRITLSYFIEPAPGEVGWKDRYRYASHALRFDLNNVGEDRKVFLKRLNAAEREKNEKSASKSGSDRWIIGSTGRNQGSIHSDCWQGIAADLATCNMVGVYPVIGWWRERPWLDRWHRKTRYALIVSIHTSNIETDIYTPVANLVSIPIVVKGKG